MSRAAANCIARMVQSFYESEPYNFSSDKTVSRCWQSADGMHLTLTLHGNEVARVSKDVGNRCVTGRAGLLKAEVRHAGWPTNTTANRLNALLKAFAIKDKVVRAHGSLTFGKQGIDLSDWTDVTVTQEQA